MGGAFDLFLVMMAVTSPWIIGATIVHYFKYKKQVTVQIAELKKEMDVIDTKELITQVDSLQERIKVLEAIVTDKGYEITEKIANLK